MTKLLFAIALGGAAGTLMRFGTGLWLAKESATAFPLATFLVNIVGCFLIGLFYALPVRMQWLTPELRLALITGFCGGLTTFSAFAYENLKLLQQGNTTLFLMYSLGSITVSLLAVIAGMNVLKIF